MWSSASRAFLLLNGGWRKFGLSQPCVPRGSMSKVCRSGFCSILGMKSIGGCSHQSTLPATRSSAASQGSGMYRQTTLSRYTFLPPVDPLGDIVARHVFGIAHVSNLLARLPLFPRELERSGADELLDLLIGGRGRDPRGHHEGHIVGRLS